MPLPKKSEIVAYWMEGDRLLRLHEIWLDWGEPSCWACDYGWEGRYDVGSSGLPLEKLLALWDRAPLQRCHIVPRCLGGDDDPDNLVLMCPECHDLSPDTLDRDLLFQWMRAQSWWVRRARKVEQAMNDFGIDTDDETLLDRLSAIQRSDEFKAWRRGRAGLHRQQLPPYGNNLSASTAVAVLLHFMREHGIPVHPSPA